MASWTRPEVLARLEDAGYCILRLPVPPNSLPSGFRVAWPAYRKQFSESYDNRAARANIDVFLPPERREISQMEECLGWLWYVTIGDHRRIVFARMLTMPELARPLVSYGHLAREMHRDRHTIERWHALGIERIMEGLHG